MIDWIEIRNFATVEHCELEFNQGFTAITGETGAGKSLIINAMQLILGARADSNVIRHGHDRSEIQANFNINSNNLARNWLKKNHLDTEECDCIIRRIIQKERSSQASINGRSVTLSQLRELGALLVDIHGQNEHHSLASTTHQRYLLDYYAGQVESVEKLGENYQDILKLEQQINKIKQEYELNQSKYEFMAFQLKELEEFAPSKGEWEELEAKHRKINHQSELISGVISVIDILRNQEYSTLNGIEKSLRHLRSLERYDPAIDKYIKSLNEAEIQIQDLVSSLSNLYEMGSVSKEDMAIIEHRFEQFHHLSRKNMTSPEMLYQYFIKLQQDLEKTNNPADKIDGLQNILENKKQEYMFKSQDITKKRIEFASKLEKKITTSMQDLSMEGGVFQIQIKKKEGMSQYGNESVIFNMSANHGLPCQPMQKTASGGEVARISLALQVALCNKNDPVMRVFDEVDVGIGGATAEVVGTQIKKLGSDMQVICVSHLPQVASKANNHILVKKNTSSNPVKSIITNLNKNERVYEIARMVSGKDITEESLLHAKKLLSLV